MGSHKRMADTELTEEEDKKCLGVPHFLSSYPYLIPNINNVDARDK
jgi:hypothetical protein